MNEQANADAVKDLEKIREIMIAEFGPRSGQPHGFAVDDRLPTWEFVSCVVRGLNTPSFKRNATNAETLEAVSKYLRDFSSTLPAGQSRCVVEEMARRIPYDLGGLSI